MRKIILAVLGIFVSSCGLKSYANSNCGDPSKGKFTCDADQISVQYDLSTIKNNQWYETNSLGKVKTYYGVKLNLNSDFTYRFKSVNAAVPVISSGGRGKYPCNSSTVGKLLYKVKLVALNSFNQEIILDEKNITRTWDGHIGAPPEEYGWLFPSLKSGCTFGTSMDITGHSGVINLASGYVENSYHDFQVKITDISEEYDGHNYVPLYIGYGEDSNIFLNINGIR